MNCQTLKSPHGVSRRDRETFYTVSYFHVEVNETFAFVISQVITSNNLSNCPTINVNSSEAERKLVLLE